MFFRKEGAKAGPVRNFEGEVGRRHRRFEEESQGCFWGGGKAVLLQKEF